MGHGLVKIYAFYLIPILIPGFIELQLWLCLLQRAGLSALSSRVCCRGDHVVDVDVRDVQG